MKKKISIGFITSTFLALTGCSDSSGSNANYPLLQVNQPLESFQLNALDFTTTDAITFDESGTYKIPRDTEESCILIGDPKEVLSTNTRLEVFDGLSVYPYDSPEMGPIAHLSNPFVFTLIYPQENQSLNNYILACQNITEKTSMRDFQKLIKRNFKIELNEERKNNPREIIYLVQLINTAKHFGLIARIHAYDHNNLLPRSFDEIPVPSGADERKYFDSSEVFWIYSQTSRSPYKRLQHSKSVSLT